MMSRNALAASTSLVAGFAALVLSGCVARATSIDGVPVMALIADNMTLHGVAPASLSNPACTAEAPAKPAHLFELSESAHATVILRPRAGDGPLPISMLHLTNIETSRTWCVMTKSDGSPAVLASDLPAGTYAVAVAEMHGSEPRAYEVKIEKL
jgi:hypothetical protein